MKEDKSSSFVVQSGGLLKYANFWNNVSQVHVKNEMSEAVPAIMKAIRENT